MRGKEKRGDLTFRSGANQVHQSSPITHTELLVEVIYVRANGGKGNADSCGNLVVRFPVRDLERNLGFANRETVSQPDPLDAEAV